MKVVRQHSFDWVANRIFELRISPLSTIVSVFPSPDDVCRIVICVETELVIDEPIAEDVGYRFSSTRKFMPVRTNDVIDDSYRYVATIVAAGKEIHLYEIME